MANLPKILLIEDSLAITKLVEFKMKNYPYELRTELDGKKGWEMIQTYKPDLIVLDVDLPSMNGYEILKAVRDEPELRATKVMMLTGNLADFQVRNIMRLKPQDFVAKPFDVRDFMIRVQKLLPVKV